MIGLSTRTFFNQVIEAVPRVTFNKNKIFLKLAMNGEADVAVMRECAGESVCQSKFVCSGVEWHEIALPDSQNDCGGLWLEISARSEFARLIGASFWIEQLPKDDSSLGVVICTFRREAQVLENLERIQKSASLRDLKMNLYVVDNGQTLTVDQLTKAPHDICLIGQQNLGGSGGFSRGIVEANARGNDFILLMDDDVSVEPEMIFRAFQIARYAEQPICVSGAMLDLLKPERLVESGAWLDSKSGLTLTSRYNGLNVYREEGLSLLASGANYLGPADLYGAWWFWLFPAGAVGKCGLPHPLFIKYDDIEYGIRLSRSGYRTIAIGNIGVHHEPFYLKDSAWPVYYFIRNGLVVGALEASDPVSRVSVVKELWKKWITAVLIYRYDKGEAVVSAVEDFLKGPDFLVELSKNHTDVMTRFPGGENLGRISPQELDQKKESAAGLRAASLLRLAFLGGHLWMNKKGAQYFLFRDVKWSRICSDEIVVFDVSGVAIRYLIRRVIFFNQMRRLIGASVALIVGYSGQKSEYRLAHNCWVGRAFWLSYLG